MSTSIHSQVYFVQNGSNRVKIGMSTSSKKRMAALRSSMDEFHFIGCIVTPLCDKLETQLHSVLHSRRRCREFFELTPEEARFIINSWDTSIENVIPEFEKINRLRDIICIQFNIKSNGSYWTKEDIKRLENYPLPFGRDSCPSTFGEDMGDLVLAPEEINYIFYDDIKEFVREVIPNITKYMPRQKHQSMYNIISDMKRAYKHGTQRLSDALKVIKFGLTSEIKERTRKYFEEHLSDEDVNILIAAPDSLDRTNIEQCLSYIENYREAYRKKYRDTRIRKLSRNGRGNLVHYQTGIVFMISLPCDWSDGYHSNISEHDELPKINIADCIAIGIQDTNSDKEGFESLLPLTQYHKDLCKEQNIKILDPQMASHVASKMRFIINMIGK